MTRRVILHVGPHKTATTYLQFRLLLARDALLAQGFDYPEYARTQFAHHALYHFLLDDAGAGVFEAEFRKHVESAPNVILSSEDFVYLAPAQLARLKALLPGHHFEIVYYLRHPAYLWPSHWQELVKHGRDVTFLEYLGGLCGWTDALDATAMDPLHHLGKFAECFGPDSLRILCLDNIVQSGADVFVHFWQRVLGLQVPAPVQSVPRLNVSMPAMRIEMLRCLNRRYRDIAGNWPGEIILQGYNAQAEPIEAMPRFAAFRDAFTQWAVKITLDSAQPVIRDRERALLARFGERIENRAAADRIFAQNGASHTLSADRHWPSRFGFASFVDDVLTRILPPAELAAIS